MPLASRASGPPDAVHINIRILREVVVDHVRDPLDIDPARCKIARDQYRKLARPELVHHRVPFGLREIAVDRVRRDALALQIPNHRIHRPLHSAEHDRQRRILVRQQVSKHPALVPRLDRHIPLLDQINRECPSRNLKLDRVLHELACKFFNLVGKGRGDKDRLTILRTLPKNFADIVAEPDVQHPVHLVKHRKLDVLKRQVPTLDHVQHTPRRAHNDLRMLAELIRLHIDRLSAVDRAHAQSSVRRELLDVLLDLHRKLARRRENNRAHRIARLNQFEKWQREARRLPSTGLRLSKDVHLSECQRDQLRLDLRRMLEPKIIHRFENVIRQPQVCKGHVQTERLFGPPTLGFLDLTLARWFGSVLLTLAASPTFAAPATTTTLFRSPTLTRPTALAILVAHQSTILPRSGRSPNQIGQNQPSAPSTTPAHHQRNGES